MSIQQPPHPLTVGFLTLGCKVNQYESEAIAHALALQGYQTVDAESDVPADAYIINTCTVTAESARKSRQFIRRAKKKNPDAWILVTGCLAQTESEQLASIEGVDYVCGNTNKMSVVDALKRLVESAAKAPQPEISVPTLTSACFEPMQITKFDRTRAYVKIEDGCENHCAYCIIPQARGPVRSRKPDEIFAEIRELLKTGCGEIVLTGIETGSYGKDFSDYRLEDLLEELDRMPGMPRIRLGSLDPSIMRPAFVEKIARLKHLAPHFHLSMQSGSDHVLAMMRRKYNTQMALEHMTHLRTVMPEIQFTTDMIVGFPGETEEDFTETLQFSEQAGFLMMHVFPFSPRKGTVAETLPNPVPEPIKQARSAKLIAAQKGIRDRVLAQYLLACGDTPQEVLFETYDETTGLAFGHTASFVGVQVPSDVPLHAVFRSVHLTGHDENACQGILCRQSSESEDRTGTPVSPSQNQKG